MTPTVTPLATQVDKLRWVQTQTKTGDVIVFSAWMLHRSTVNQSDRDRAVYYAT